MPVKPQLEQAIAFCEKAHADQTRKYTGEPYHVHPQAVADIVASVTKDIDVICAALLHDVVEDTDVSIYAIQKLFGPRVARFVGEVTDLSRPEDGNRAERKRIDREHLAKASAAGQTIKLADLIDNTRSIVKHAPSFAKVYLAEKRLLLEVLTAGHIKLRNQAGILLSDSCFQLHKLEKGANNVK